ncbi:hypothetical protein [Streptomyces sp. AK02-01A]|uniref:hypothetical protein n=1 Tax=Streptomyces sp. AK02-01A TaxID=3028648 RepID=UPI0029B3833F|nr:hypothetical protein [Streptomyces sp. AK02-01A]MDX3855351.1 hypothetical protein [Streptomyces sp. AK02-01A]
MSQPDADTNGRNLRFVLAADPGLPSEIARGIAPACRRICGAAAGQLAYGLVLDGELLVMAGDDLSSEALRRRAVAGRNPWSPIGTRRGPCAR